MIARPFSTPTERRLIDDRRGNLAIITALAVVPVLGLVGGGLDYMTAANGELQLRQSLDSAAFAAARPYDIEESERRAIATAYMRDNLPERLASQPWTMDLQALEDGVVASASLSIDTAFLSMVGISELEIHATARVSRDSSRGLELVLAMDTTNSMKGISGGWDQAIGQIGEVIDRVLGDGAGGSTKMVSIIPFTDRVGIGTDRSNWLAGTAPAGWGGCVEPREESIGSLDYALDDDPFDAEPFIASVPGVTGGLTAKGSGYPHCGPAITGPTTDSAMLEQALSVLDARGTGRFDEVMAWGWRMLSPKWTGAWGTPGYPTPRGEAQKVIALFTDGHSTAYHFETIPFPRTSGIYNDLTPEGGELLVDLCRRIIADGIDIFVFYVNGSTVSRPYFERCTNDSERFFAIGGVEELTTALQSMLGTGRLRLVY